MGVFCFAVWVTQRWGIMEPEPGTSSPQMPELTLDAPPPATSVYVAILGFLARLEAAGAGWGVKKRPLPEPASGDVSDMESGSGMSEAAGFTHMDSEDVYAAVSVAGKILLELLFLRCVRL